MMNSNKHIDAIEIKVIPDTRRAFPDGGGLFQPDRVPSFSSNKVSTISRKKKLNVLDWPGNSLYLHPIENFWSIKQSRLQTLNCTTMTKLIEAINEVWYRTLNPRKLKLHPLTWILPKTGRIYVKASNVIIVLLLFLLIKFLSYYVSIIESSKLLC